jgi:hypothetical protein
MKAIQPSVAPLMNESERYDEERSVDYLEVFLRMAKRILRLRESEAGCPIRYSYNKAHVNQYLEVLNTVPFLALQKKDIAGLLRLLDSGISPNLVARRKSLLQQAIQNKQNDAVILLLRNGALPVHSHGSYNAIDTAVESGNIEAIRALAAAGGSMNEPNLYGLSPLLTACRNNNTTMIRELVSLGADMEAVDAQGRTPLHYVTKLNLPQIVAVLIGLGANINAKTLEEGNSPLMIAVMYNNKKLTEFLCKKGASKKVTNRDGKTVIGLAPPTMRTLLRTCGRSASRTRKSRSSRSRKSRSKSRR